MSTTSRTGHRRLPAIPPAILFLATTGLATAAIAAPPSSVARKPNIVVILADDLGYADLGCQGATDLSTPHIDALARSGVRCTNGYVSGPYCSPTLAGLLTGRYQQRFGHEFNPPGEAAEDPEGARSRVGLPTSETTFADRLKAAGYATGLIGKWHLGAAPQFHPQQRGFIDFFGFLGGAHSYFPGDGPPILRGTEPVDERAYLTDALAREAVAFIDRHKATPFFLYLSFNAVHTPMHADDARLAKFTAIRDPQRRIYAAMLLAMDDAVGQVRQKLRGEGLETDTLVFFLSDNGGPTMPGTTVNASRNDPLRGSKRTTLEGGIRVPFLVAWPGTLPAGVIYEKPVIQLDILPTALAAVGTSATPEWKLDGVNLLPFLTGTDSATPHETLYWRFGEQMAIRRGDWKLVKYDLAAELPTGPDAPRRVPSPGISPPRLYNLRDDLGEKNDLATQHPDKFRELEAAWNTWEAQLAPPLWGGRSPRRGD